jgi:hypothetical protein
MHEPTIQGIDILLNLLSGRSIMLWFDPSTSGEPAHGSGVEGLVAAGIALLRTLITVGIGWLKDREVSTRRMKQIEESAKRVEFWRNFVGTAEALFSEDEVAQFRDRAKAEVIGASLEVESIFRATEPGEPPDLRSEVEIFRDRLPWWRRWFLIYVPPSKGCLDTKGHVLCLHTLACGLANARLCS